MARGQPGRLGAGRPRKNPFPDEGAAVDGNIDWGMIRNAARLGAERDLITTALGLTAKQLASPAFQVQLAAEVERGHALYKLDLLGDVRRMRKGGATGGGSVHATLAALREAFGWDRPGHERRGPRPDQQAAVAEVDRILRRFRPPGKR